MKNMFRKFISFLGIKKPYKIQTFTYYIPSPPPRKSGYREKQFDKVFYAFINKGYEILDFKTQSNAGQESSGMWIIATVRATNKEADQLDLESYFIDQVVEAAPEKEEESIDGLYQINN